MTEQPFDKFKDYLMRQDPQTMSYLAESYQAYVQTLIGSAEKDVASFKRLAFLNRFAGKVINFKANGDSVKAFEMHGAEINELIHMVPWVLTMLKEMSVAMDMVSQVVGDEKGLGGFVEQVAKMLLIIDKTICLDADCSERSTDDAPSTYDATRILAAGMGKTLEMMGHKFEHVMESSESKGIRVRQSEDGSMEIKIGDKTLKL